mmetsp:Transcript_19442/g.49837  ORF Transcript_19442/g.49837 Transcript_19442/m.49837 type:complete len:470 (-) Transcript_19442:506-1915(-)
MQPRAEYEENLQRQRQGKLVNFRNDHAELRVEVEETIFDFIRKLKNVTVISSVGNMRVGKSTVTNYLINTLVPKRLGGFRPTIRCPTGHSNEPVTRGIDALVFRQEEHQNPGILLLDSQGMQDATEKEVHARTLALTTICSSVQLVHVRGIFDRTAFDALRSAFEGSKILEQINEERIENAREQVDFAGLTCTTIIVMHDATTYEEEIERNKDAECDNPYNVTKSEPLEKIVQEFAEARDEGTSQFGKTLLSLLRNDKLFVVALPTPDRKELRYLKDNEATPHLMPETEDPFSFRDGLSKLSKMVENLAKVKSVGGHVMSGEENEKLIKYVVASSQRLHLTNECLKAYFCAAIAKEAVREALATFDTKLEEIEKDTAKVLEKEREKYVDDKLQVAKVAVMESYSSKIETAGISEDERTKMGYELLEKSIDAKIASKSIAALNKKLEEACRPKSFIKKRLHALALNFFWR